MLVSQMCTAADWDDIEVVDGFDVMYVRNCRFSGKIRMGRCGDGAAAEEYLPAPIGIDQTKAGNTIAGVDSQYPHLPTS